MPISRTNDQPILSPRLILGIGLAILLLISSASICLEEKSRRDTVATALTVSMLKQFADLKVLLHTAESSARGFALTGDKGFADEFHRARDAIAPAFAALLYVTDDPAQRRLVEQTGELAGHCLAASDELIHFRSTSESAGMPAGKLVAETRRASQTIAENLDKGQAELREQLERQSAQSRLTSRIVLAVDLCGVALILLLAGALIRKARRSRRELADSLSATRASKESLEVAVAERTEHLVAAHEELRRSSAVLQSTFHSMAEAVLVIDTNSHVLLSNPAAAKMLRFQPGMSVPELRALTAGVFRADGTTPLPPDEMPAARALQGEEFEDTEVVTRRMASGSLRHFVVSGRPLRDTSGAITGAALVCHDISASRETERKLQQSQKLDAIGKLTGGVAHDFNNMLTVITGTTEQLVTELADQPRLRATAALIDQATQRCTELIEHLLAFARRQPLHPRNVDVNATISDVAKLLRPTLGEQIEIKTMLEANVAAAHVDASQLANSVLNMAINARDAMPDGGTLTIETRMVSHEASGLDAAPMDPGRYLMISVSDTGTGMPAHVRERVFEPFFTTKDVGKGSGLGLPMVYGFVTQSGGHIRVDSEEGRGTTIRLYLPPAPGEAVQAAGNARAAAGGNETILVVEDDALVRNFVTAQLLGLGYRAVAAADGPAALEKIKNGEGFDLLLTDVVMPGGMTGRQLASEVGKIRPGTKVLYTSGYPDDTIMHHGKLDAGVLLLQKPYRKAQLAQMVRQALAG